MTGRRRGQGSPSHCCLLLATVPPLLGSFRGPGRARCLPDFQEGRNLVPWEVEEWHPAIHLPPLAGPLGKEGGRRKTVPLQISEHSCLVSQSVRLPRRVRSPGFTAERHDD